MLAKGNEVVTSSDEDTLQQGRLFASYLQGSEVVALFGEVGSGKTTFVKGVITELLQLSFDQITSPTFHYLSVYEGSKFSVYHFDLYRMTVGTEFEKAGFFDYLQGDGVCCLEWADRIEKQLPQGTIRVIIQHLSATKRSITIR